MEDSSNTDNLGWRLRVGKGSMLQLVVRPKGLGGTAIQEECHTLETTPMLALVGSLSSLPRADGFQE